MKAMILEEFGGVENLKMVDIPTPTVAWDEVLVQVKAISINPVDVKARKGYSLNSILSKCKPVILGWDISGVVVKTGSGVDQFGIGDEVFGMVNFMGHGKAYAEYVAAPAAHLVKKPKGISHSEAAASCLAALTAWQAFTHFGKLKKGDRALIHAASGGVGHFAVQIAKYLGAYVIGTSSAPNRDFVLQLGADEHIDYREQPFEKVVSDIDFCLEAMGRGNFGRSVEVVKQGGTIVNLPSGLTEEEKQKAQDKQLQGSFFMQVFSGREDMQVIADMLEKGRLKPHISHTFPFDQLADAHRQVESGRTVGKVLVTL
ncbi:NADP-dependent oxidoreductase [Prolixibacter denitrificans]|nr:NADP-dependent oxidoreductase [Prolixibacter denitrificans]PSK84814.1 NADPH:quinone reductase-like Zn-dependent oxidoreductase [Prolixibacter denitrificans]